MRKFVFDKWNAICTYYYYINEIFMTLIPAFARHTHELESHKHLSRAPILCLR